MGKKGTQPTRDGGPPLGPEAIEALDRSASQLAEQGPALRERLEALGPGADQAAVFALATEHDELRLTGYLLQLKPEERRSVLKLEGGLTPEEAERALEPVKVLEVLPQIREHLAHVWPSAFTPIPVLFISASYEDAGAAWRLRPYLATLIRTGRLRLVENNYSLLRVPTNHGERLAAIQQADIILLFISPAYLDSDDYFGEMERALARVRKGESVRVIPVLLQPTPLEGTPIEDLQPLPAPDRTIATAGEAAWIEVEAGIRQVLRARTVPQTTRGKPRQVFLISAQRDAQWRERLEMGLRPLVRQGRIEVWHEGQVLPGDSIPETRERRFVQADLVLVLISANLLASDLDTSQTRRAVQEKKPILAIPLTVVDQTVLQDEALIATKDLITSHPASHWSDQDDLWMAVVNRIRNLP